MWVGRHPGGPLLFGALPGVFPTKAVEEDGPAHPKGC